jgi:hypothetical protein
MLSAYGFCFRLFSAFLVDLSSVCAPVSCSEEVEMPFIEANILSYFFLVAQRLIIWSRAIGLMSKENKLYTHKRAETNSCVHSFKFQLISQPRGIV